MADAKKIVGNTAKTGGFGVGKFVAVLIIIGIIGFAVFFVVGTAPPPALQSFTNSQGAVPIAYSTALGPPGSSLNGLVSVIANHTNTTNQFHVNYSGTIYAKLNGFGSAFGTVSSPLYLWLSQYSGSKKLSATVTSASAAGMINLQYVLVPGPYICTNFNTTAVSQGSITALIVSKTPQCVSGDTVYGLNMSQMYNFDFAQFSNFGMNFNYVNGYQSTYQGVPCTAIFGTITGSAGSGHFVMCMSDRYFVPLSIGINFTGQQGDVVIILNETDIGNYSVQSAVTSLPYPTV